MAGGRSTEYSSDEGESDTEEYREGRHKVNPVTGCQEKVVSSHLSLTHIFFSLVQTPLKA